VLIRLSLSALPSQDLLTSIHQHASTLLSTSHNILPPLTPSFPRHSSATIAHFDALTDAQAQAETERLTSHPTHRNYKAVAGERVIKAIGEKSIVKQIGNRETWKNAERGFEASALVAVGEFLRSRLLLHSSANWAKSHRHVYAAPRRRYRQQISSRLSRLSSFPSSSKMDSRAPARKR
jgi:hypothetical protein